MTGHRSAARVLLLNQHVNGVVYSGGIAFSSDGLLQKHQLPPLLLRERCWWRKSCWWWT